MGEEERYQVWRAIHRFYALAMVALERRVLLARSLRRLRSTSK